MGEFSRFNQFLLNKYRNILLSDTIPCTSVDSTNKSSMMNKTTLILMYSWPQNLTRNGSLNLTVHLIRTKGFFEENQVKQKNCFAYRGFVEFFLRIEYKFTTRLLSFLYIWQQSVPLLMKYASSMCANTIKPWRIRQDRAKENSIEATRNMFCNDDAYGSPLFCRKVFKYFRFYFLFLCVYV